MSKALDLVHKQTADEGLWFYAETAPEVYLQEALRELHAAVEEDRRTLVDEWGNPVVLKDLYDMFKSQLVQDLTVPVQMTDEELTVVDGSKWRHFRLTDTADEVTEECECFRGGPDRITASPEDCPVHGGDR